MSDENQKSSWLESGIEQRLRESQKAAERDLAQEPVYGPQPSGAWLRAHRERLQQAEGEREAAETQQFVASWQDIAQRQLATFAALPCKGVIEHVDACSDAYASICERASSPSCPREIIALDRRQERAALAKRLAGAGVPQLAVQAVSEFFVASEATGAMDEFLAAGNLLYLVLSGTNQVGKSVAAAYGIKRKGGLFVPPSLLEEASDFGVEPRKLKRRMLDASLIVLDDLGMEAINARLEALILTLMVERENNGLKTVATTNLRSEEFFSRFSDRRIIARFETKGWITPYLTTPPTPSGTKASAGEVAALVIIAPRAWFTTDGAMALACAAPDSHDHNVTTARARIVVQLAAVNGALRRKGPRAVQR